jgi:transcriptional regulator GlxA family with amidase domain
MLDAKRPRPATIPPVPHARVAFLLISGFAMIGYASVIETLRAANQLAGSPLYAWRHICPSGNHGTASNGVEIRCDTSFDSTDAFDFVFVCASDEAVTFDDPRTLAWLRAQAAKGAVMAGIGGGAFLLARAGLLRGVRITLHWAYAPAFAEQFTDVDLHRSLYEIDDNRMTCGGGVSPLDMMHAMIIHRHGIELAMKVSEWILHTEVRDSQESQRFSLEMRLGVKHAGLVRVLKAMDNAIEDPLPRSELVEISGVSERQLDRLFLSQLGISLTAYYLRLRLNRARSLVLQTAMSMTEIAIASGFNSNSTFSKSYRSEFNMSPTADRELAFRGRRATLGLYRR